MLEGAIACVRDIVVFLYLIQKCAAQEISAAEVVRYYGIAMQFSNFVTVFVHSYSQLQTGSKESKKSGHTCRRAKRLPDSRKRNVRKKWNVRGSGGDLLSGCVVWV